jgi:hypothetical protein
MRSDARSSFRFVVATVEKFKRMAAESRPSPVYAGVYDVTGTPFAATGERRKCTGERVQ